MLWTNYNVALIYPYHCTGGFGKLEQENYKICQSPRHTLYYVPTCEESVKPRVGQVFGSKDEAELLYSAYAKICGFIVRSATETKSKDGSTIWKYYLCGREGFAPKRDYNTEESFKRRRIYDRCGCQAKIKIRIDGPGRFILKEFEERHNHPLVPTSQKYLMRSNRKLSSHHQDFIINCLKTNIGASKAYKLYKNSVGSYSGVGATLVDFKNLSRDLNFYMKGCDGQMVIDSLFQKKERSGAFYFAYDLNERHELCRLFWSDGLCRRSFKTFGDVVSADATYKSNR